MTARLFRAAALLLLLTPLLLGADDWCQPLRSSQATVSR